MPQEITLPARYRVTKIDATKDALFASASTVDEYREGLSKKYGFSPPVDYYAEGVVVFEPAVGHCFMMARDNRNGVPAVGVFQSSRVTAVSEKDGVTFFTTLNSSYKLEEIQ